MPVRFYNASIEILSVNLFAFAWIAKWYKATLHLLKPL
jgi:hypothetical protein